MVPMSVSGKPVAFQSACIVEASQRNVSNVPKIGAILKRWVMLP
jgi:hypothetical protein